MRAHGLGEKRKGVKWLTTDKPEVTEIVIDRVRAPNCWLLQRTCDSLACAGVSHLQEKSINVRPGRQRLLRTLCPLASLVILRMDRYLVQEECTAFSVYLAWHNR